MRDVERLSVLLLCDDNAGQANTVLEHIGAFRHYSRHRVMTYNPRGLRRAPLLSLDEFDVVVIHYSLVPSAPGYLPNDLRQRLRDFRGLKVQFIQDEYCWVDAVTAATRDLGVQVLFSCVPPAEVPKLYGPRLPGVTILPTLTGYVPDLAGQQTVPSLAQRPIEIGYRGRSLPYWLGELSQEKVWIGQGVLERAPRYGLHCDIGWREDERIYGERWNAFLMNCRATLGTESGASIADFDGSVERGVKAYRATHPDADFAAISQAVLRPVEGNVRVNVISPRVFEAVALRTALIQFPGTYSGIVEPWRHYIPLAKDFSNMDEVVERLRDDAFLAGMTERAFQDVVASGRYSYRAFMQEFDAAIEQHVPQRPRGHQPRWSRLARAVRPLLQPVPAARQRLGEQRALRLERTLKGGAAVPASLADPDLRRLLGAYVRSDRARAVIAKERLLTDLLKLAVLLQPPSLADFALEAQLDAEAGRLTLCAIQGPAAGRLVASSPGPEVSELRSRLAEALASQQVREIVWDHSAVAATAPYVLAGRVRVPVGGEQGRNVLSAVVELTRLCPTETTHPLASALARAAVSRQRLR